MWRTKFYYDEEKLVYTKIATGFTNRLRTIFLFLIASALIGFLMLFILNNYAIIETPREKVQVREIEQYKLQLTFINKKMDQLEKVMANIQDRDNNIYRMYFEANPLPNSQRQAGFGGINRYKTLEGYENSELIVNTIKHLEVLQRQAVVQSKSLDKIAELAKDKENLLASIPAIQPISNEDLTRVASGFGWRTDPFTKGRRMHWGIDFTAPRGTPIYASGDGKVLRADNKSAGYGKHIRIDHGYGYLSLYAHLSKYTVIQGQKVKRGDVIGYVGSTGRSQAPHLHYEISKEGNRINPINFYYGSLSVEEFEEMLKVASQENQSLD